MACTAPRVGRRSDFGGVEFVAGVSLDVADAANREETDPERRYLFIPCGTCRGCRAARAFEWVVRCRLETREWDSYVCITLTYRDETCPVTLSKRHVQLFHKRLRARLGARRYRHFTCGEYGEEGGRPHYHAVLFGLHERDTAMIESAWSKGYVQVQAGTVEGIAYIVGYVQKKLDDPSERREERVDCSTGEVYFYQPPFRQMSRGGRQGVGIGGLARDRYWRDFRTAFHLDGEKVPPGRYLQAKFQERASDSDLAKLQAEKEAFLQRPRERTLKEELRVNRILHEARATRDAERRRLK